MWIYQRSKNSIVKMKSQGGMRSEQQVQTPQYILYTYLRMFNVNFIFYCYITLWVKLSKFFEKQI